MTVDDVVQILGQPHSTGAEFYDWNLPSGAGLLTWRRIPARWQFNGQWVEPSTIILLVAGVQATQKEQG